MAPSCRQQPRITQHPSELSSKRRSGVGGSSCRSVHVSGYVREHIIRARRIRGRMISGTLASLAQNGIHLGQDARGDLRSVLRELSACEYLSNR